MFEINNVSIFKCFSETEKSPDKLGIISKEGIEEENNGHSQEILNIAEELTSRLITNPDLGGKNAPKYRSDSVGAGRIHEFKDWEFDDDKIEYKVQKRFEILNNIRNSEDIEKNAGKIANMYSKQNYSRPGLLLISNYTYKEKEFVSIIKTPFEEDAWQATPEDVLREVKDVIIEQVHKGILFPSYYFTKEELEEEKAKVYQGTNYSDYWWKFLGFKENKIPNERINDYAVSDDSILREVSSLNDLEKDEVREKLEEIKNSKIKIEIGDIELKLELDDLSQDTINFYKRDNIHYLVIEGESPKIRTRKGSKRLPVFPNLNEFPSLEELIRD